MNTKHTKRASIAILTLLIAVSTNAPAFGHDPLREGHDPHHDDHHSEHHNISLQRANLSEIRELVTVFRQSGDDQYLDQAWALLQPALAAAILDPETLIAAAFVAQSRHDFEYAVKLINKALAINSHSDEGWLLLASIQLVRGDTESAAMACRNLRAVPSLVLLTCNARVALATGGQQIAFGHLISILKLTDAQRLPPDMLAWSYSVAGDLAVATGDAEQAIALYRHSLTLAQRTQVRAALVDVLLSRTEFEAAWQTLQDGSLALPLLVRRLIVAKNLGSLHELQPTLSRVQREFEMWIAQEDWLHAREMARFYIDVLDQPEIARRLALINLSLQNEPEDRRLEVWTRSAGSRQNNALRPIEAERNAQSRWNLPVITHFNLLERW